MKMLVIPLVLLLAGCMLSPEARLAKHEEKCAAYGFSPETLQFARCLQLEETTWQANWQRAMRNIQDAGAAMQRAAPPHYAPRPPRLWYPPRTLNCVTSHVGWRYNQLTCR